MDFTQWMTECGGEMCRRLGWNKNKFDAHTECVGMGVYKDKFERGMTPEQCVDDELLFWFD